MFYLKRILLIITFCLLSLFCYAEDELVEIGVLAKRGSVICLKQWSATADYLTDSLPGCKFTIIPLPFDSISYYVETEQVDFILVNSSMYVALETKYGVNRIATLRNKHEEESLEKYGEESGNLFGGVVFCHKNRVDIKDFKDIKGRDFVSVDETSFGGFQMAWRELLAAGVDPYKDCNSISFAGTHDAVVNAVLNGDAEVGTVRTGILEKMSQEGSLHINDLHIINMHHGCHFPYLHSTRAYPEWPMAKIKSTSNKLAEKVAVALINMPSDSQAARAGAYNGWTIPMNYQNVHECLKELKITPYENLGKIAIKDVMKKYWLVIILIFIIIIVMAVSIYLIYRFSMHLKKEIEHRKVIQEQLEKAIKKAEDATRTKSMFLANMSHEIRTPLNAINGMSYIMKQHDLSGVQSKYLQKIEMATSTLMGIINDILDFSKVEAGKMALEETGFNLASVIDNVSVLVENKAVDKGLDFVVSYGPHLNMNLYGDPLRLGQILTNLVNNAVKFTDQGEVGIYISKVKTGRYRFIVKDTGIGMTDEQQQKLFQSFSQADSSTTRKYGGTGLGLVISLQLVELMNGTIKVESQTGVGTSFIVEIDIKEQDEFQPVTSNVDFSSKNILVVDDTVSWQNVIKDLLEQFSINVDVAANGEQALKMVAEKNYDLTLMDWNMPGINGIDVVKKMKEKCPDIPKTIIMVSAYRLEHVANLAKMEGIEFFLQKPVNPSLLFNLLLDFFSAANVKNDIQKIDKALARKNIPDLKSYNMLLAEDNSMNREIIHGMLEKTGITIEDAVNGVEAVGMFSEEPDMYNIILMDIQMPEIDGYEAAMIIRKKSDIPIIALTANVMHGEAEKVYEAGMNEYLPKPVDVDKLFEYLQKYLVVDEFASITDHSLELELPEFNNLDSAKGLKHMAGNIGLYFKILDDFVKSYKGVTETIKTLLDTDMESAKRLIHTIKGLSANIGALKLSEITEKLYINQEEVLLAEFEEELEKVVAEISASEYFQQSQKNHSGLLETISDEDVEVLLKKLKTVLVMRNPRVISNISEKLESVRPDARYGELVQQLLPLLNNFDYTTAGQILEKVNL